MDALVWFVLHVVDALTFGWLSHRGTRHGRTPDPAEVWHDEERRREADRVAGEALVGRRGLALTALRPAGRVAVEGLTYEAASESGFVEAGAPIEVVGRGGFALIVRETPADDPTPRPA